MWLIRQSLAAIFFFVAIMAVADEPAGADAQLENILADYWDYYLAADPIAATAACVNDFLPEVYKPLIIIARNALPEVL
jgi:hypothetical protein